MNNHTCSEQGFRYGVVMGYYGELWQQDIYLAWPEIMGNFGHSFFIYAPKKDELLRRRWNALWNDNQLAFLQSIAQKFQKNGISFGVGFSPYGIEKLDIKTKKNLAQKIAQINSIGGDILGIFFDDIEKKHLHTDIANVQVDIAHYIASLSNAHSLYTVPSYYCYDIILTNILGTMPEKYWQDFAKIDTCFDIFWSGDKIISTHYSQRDCQYMSECMGRKVSLWDNYPVTDPYYLQDKLFIGPHTAALPQIADWYACHALNPMQYGWCSMLSCSTLQQLYSGLDYIPRQAWFDNTIKICGESFAEKVNTYLNYFILVGKNNISKKTKSDIIKTFTPFLYTKAKPFAQEILAFLQNTHVPENAEDTEGIESRISAYGSRIKKA